jgi:hypothetical protein
VLRVLEYLEQAIEEAEAVALEYTERSPCAAVASSDETDEAEVSISKLPDAYPQFDHGTRRYLLRRVPFSLVYRVEQTRIVIVAVAHGRRRPGYWHERLSRSKS